jgi:single-strand DNA-binding protein
MALNVWTGIGRLGKNPEIVMLADGKQKTTFSIAVPRDYKDGEGNRQSDWFECVGWGKGFANYAMTVHLGKGDEVCVTGRIRRDTLADGDDSKKTFTTVSMERLYLVAKNRKNKDGAETGCDTTQAAPQAGEKPEWQQAADAQMQRDLDNLPF